MPVSETQGDRGKRQQGYENRDFTGLCSRNCVSEIKIKSSGRGTKTPGKKEENRQKSNLERHLKLARAHTGKDLANIRVV